ncbi:uncharacterized protein LOC127775895 isoform X2 [Oryza glaberrima]|uniref:uncharacterized protein LOC127775895 isoform X2 n=1 Tax=Oryza glaberrima TaxID=4538 RepID=UPI00224C327E|nr:uncharacterized protein LOC127775895 isoform X2 [Oryza glaberrima]
MTLLRPRRSPFLDAAVSVCPPSTPPSVLHPSEIPRPVGAAGRVQSLAAGLKQEQRRIAAEAGQGGCGCLSRLPWLINICLQGGLKEIRSASWA